MESEGGEGGSKQQEELVYTSNGSSVDEVETSTMQNDASTVGNVKKGLDLLRKGRLAIDEVGL